MVSYTIFFIYNKVQYIKYYFISEFYANFLYIDISFFISKIRFSVLEKERMISPNIWILQIFESIFLTFYFLFINK